MAKNTDFAVPVAAAEAVLALGKPPVFAGSTVYRDRQSNVQFRHRGNGVFDVENGNNYDRGEFIRRAQAAARRALGSNAGAPATERQITFLTDLIVGDPAGAMAIGASPDGDRVTPGLSKADASRMIDLLTAGV